MYPLNYFLFLQIILFLFITPGTPRIVIISYSMNYGVQKCIWTALGDVTANIIQATLVIFVIGSFFSDNPNFLNIVKWIGVIYLLYLAYDIYNSRLKDINSNNIKSKSFLSFFKDGFLVAGTSPKAWMFFPLIFPQFIDFNSNYVIQFLILDLDKGLSNPPNSTVPTTLNPCSIGVIPKPLFEKMTGLLNK